MEKKHVAVLGDLTALYSTRTRDRKNIDYAKLDAILKSLLKVNSFGFTKFFTLFQQTNEKQVSFLEFLKKTLNWEIEVAVPAEVRRFENHLQYRFDSRIAYVLGDLATDPDFNRVVILSDSYDLAKPALDAAKYLDEVKIAFFGSSMDWRWHDIFNNPENKISFIDLEKEFSKYRPREVDEDSEMRYES